MTDRRAWDSKPRRGQRCAGCGRRVWRFKTYFSSPAVHRRCWKPARYDMWWLFDHPEDTR